MTQANRRKDARARASIRFWYRMPWSRAWQSAKTVDFSLGGLSFVMPEGFCLKGLPVEVAVDVPAAAFRSHTRVARVTRGERGRRVGLRFTDVPAHIREKLNGYVERQRSIQVRHASSS